MSVTPWGIALKKRIERQEEKLPYAPQTIAKFIVDCRKDKGIPMFKTKFVERRFEYKGKPAVWGICWAGEEKVTNSILFTEANEEDIKRMEEGTGDWKWLINKYGTEEQRREVFKEIKIVLGR